MIKTETVAAVSVIVIVAVVAVITIPLKAVTAVPIKNQRNLLFAKRFAKLPVKRQKMQQETKMKIADVGGDFRSMLFRCWISE